MSLSVRRNHDYTITVVDSKNREISFRDIKGSDLEYLDSVLKGGDDEEPKEIKFDQVVDILSRLCIREIDFKDLTQRTIVRIFDHIKEQLLCNYMSKYDWLRQCYAIQNGSFAGLPTMEEVPMSKFVAMVQIHQDAVEAIKKDP